MKQVFDGKIGDIVAIETTYNSHGVWEPRKTREECASDMEYQMRNWYYYTLALGRPHRRAGRPRHRHHGLGDGRQAAGTAAGVSAAANPAPTRNTAIFMTTSRWFMNTRTTSAAITTAATGSRPTPRVKDYILGSQGVADVFGNAISGKNKWRYRGPKTNMYQVEHDEMFAAIRAGKPINNGEAAAHSTLLALMGRTAAYTGQTITPETILNSKEDLSPPRYEFGPLPCRRFPVPWQQAVRLNESSGEL